MFGWLKRRTTGPSPLERATDIRDDRATGVRSYQFKEDARLQSRPAQVVSDAFAAAVRSVCERHSSVRACFLLDARWPPSTDERRLVLLDLADAADLKTVAPHMIAALKGSPECSRTLVGLRSEFDVQVEGCEFYRRG